MDEGDDDREDGRDHEDDSDHDRDRPDDRERRRRAALDPAARAVAREVRAAGVPPWHELSVGAARRVEDEVFSAGVGPSVAAARDLAFDGPGGDLPVRVYRPEGVGPAATDRPGDAGDGERPPVDEGGSEDGDGEAGTEGDGGGRSGDGDGEHREGDGASEDGDGDGGGGPPSSVPVVLFCHGGGWATGTLDSADDLCRRLAAGLPAVVVSLDYRLAPEDQFPAAVDDAYAAARWVVGVADTFGADPERLVLAGSSAGATLAAATALRLRETGPAAGPDPVAQVLLYPATDPDPTRASHREFAETGATAGGDAGTAGGGGAGDADTVDGGDDADGATDPVRDVLLTRADVRWFWGMYLRSEADRHNPLAAPVRADPAGTPPAVVVTAGHDPLRDEGIAYADALDDAGVPVEHLHYPTLPHGFLSLADRVDRAGTAWTETLEAVRGRLDGDAG